MKGLSKESATSHEVGEEGEAQRIDNYLTRLLKGVPKSHVYRILRSGEVRVNSRRVGPEHRLKAGDRVRVPPIRVAHRSETAAGRMPAAPRTPVAPRFAGRILFEDDALLVIDKPAGVAVHGGSGVSSGVIEQLRHERPQARFLELVHRLDRDTSGVLVLAKKRSALTDLHRQLREGAARKLYLALTKGRWTGPARTVAAPLHKYVLPSGERRVRVHDEGQTARTIFRAKRLWSGYSLVEAELKTGRTHQIRVHLAHVGHPIAGDDKYGDFDLNKSLAREGLKRMFLHACQLTVRHPVSGEAVTFEAPLPAELATFVDRLNAADAPTL
ncbi:MAG TPA: RluA family pseudouridine synthase [Burkholderiales bacterium]|nr:RluA family pseudouridine synthase [Burkholderiales bacterium]